MTNPFALNTPAPAPATATPVAPAPAPAAVPAPTQPFAQGGIVPPDAPAGDPFDGPAPQRPKGPRLQEMYGRLLIVKPIKLEEGIPNRLGKPGDTQDRMTADVVVLDGGPINYGGRPEKPGGAPHDKVAQVPHVQKAMYISAVGLISQCRDALAKRITQGTTGMVLGRLGLGQASGEQNAPYLLSPPTDADRAIARQYLATVDPFA